MGVSVFAWLLNSVLGEDLVKHAPNVISKKSFMSFLVDLKSKSFILSVFRKIPNHFSEELHLLKLMIICKQKRIISEIREES